MGDVLNPYEIKETAGNGALLFVTDSQNEGSYYTFLIGIIPALNHLGIPYRIFDLKAGKSLSDAADNSAGVILAQDGIAAAIDESQWSKLLELVESGLGIASFDGCLEKAPALASSIFGLKGLHAGEIDSVTASDSDHYVGAMQDSGIIHKLRNKVKASIPDKISAGFHKVAVDETGQTLLVVGNKKYRSAALLFSPSIWLRENFGHAMGLDDLLWRSLIWIAAKPFATLMMPPFVTCRIDDASGSYDHFQYVDTLNKHEWLPNIGVFVDDIDKEDGLAMKRLHDSEKAQFSAHSFHEIGDPSPDMIYIQHDGKEWPVANMVEHFKRLDAFYSKIGVTPSKTVNIHYDELGINSMPFLLARNQPFMMALIPATVDWDANSYCWEPYPYGHQGMNYGPLDPDHRFWNVMGFHLAGYKTPDVHMNAGEFMGGNTVFAGESSFNNVAGAIKKGTYAVKMGVASAFFGTLMCHEQRIASVSHEEWEAIISGISKNISKWDVIQKDYDFISQYTKDKALTRVTNSQADTKTGRISVELCGKVENTLSCHIYTNDGDSCKDQLIETAPFEGKYRVEQ